MVALCVLLAWKAPRPDVLISADAGMVAVRDASGGLRVLSSRRDEFVLKEWLAADGDARSPKDPTLGEGTRCDSNGCVARLRRRAGGGLVADRGRSGGRLRGRGPGRHPAQRSAGMCRAPPSTANVRDPMARWPAHWDGRTMALEAARPPTSQRPWITQRDQHRHRRSRPHAAPRRPRSMRRRGRRISIRRS